MLESYLQERLKEKEILLMTHIVLGYPSLNDSYKIVETMVEAGVDLMELQIPFSEPIADGPVILHANQKALERGATVNGCLRVAKEITKSFEIPFLIMSYFNILFKHGIQRFVSTMEESALRGAIIPDLPPEEGEIYLKSMAEKSLDPILIFSPTTSMERMIYLNTFARGLIYCVSRKGVTGENTDFSGTLNTYITKCREATSLPLAVGFGIKEKADIDFLRGKADIAVIGTQTIRVMEEQGITALGDFIRSLR